MNNRSQQLAGLLILIVEDEAMVAMMLEDLLQDLGCRVTIAGSIGEALELIRGERPDGVLLDMNIHGTRTTPIAEELAARSVPFLLVTGYAASESDPPLIRSAPRLQKPFKEELLSQRMAEVFIGEKRQGKIGGDVPSPPNPPAILRTRPE